MLIAVFFTPCLMPTVSFSDRASSSAATYHIIFSEFACLLQFVPLDLFEMQLRRLYLCHKSYIGVIPKFSACLLSSSI